MYVYIVEHRNEAENRDSFNLYYSSERKAKERFAQKMIESFYHENYYVSIEWDEELKGVYIPRYFKVDKETGKKDIMCSWEIAEHCNFSIYPTIIKRKIVR